MKYPHLGLVAISTYALLAESVVGARKQHMSNREFRDFNYPTRAKARSLGPDEVDLGYEIHKGIESDSKKFLAFKNIPYAEPLTEDYRFTPAVNPQTIREEVNNGSVNHICPQTQVGWVPFAQDFLGNFSKLILPDVWRYPITAANNYSTIPNPLPEFPFPADEDCLTLDVMVPKSVWENKESTLAAVVVWIYGGGFIFGWKSQYGSPEGLFTAAEDNDQLSEENIIYVAMNYRLGAFGWLGGKKFEEDGGFPNLGLHDQALAMKWVKKYVQDFGGDPSRITVMGQSAGASSILHHVTAGGGKEVDRPAFDAAILQSPGFFPQPNNTKNDLAYSRFLHLAGAEDLADLKGKDTAVLQQANAIMTYESEYGYFNFGPTVDGDYVPDLPGRLLAAGDFHTGISMLTGHQALDGLLFTPPWIRTNAGLAQHSQDLYPGIPPEVLSNISSRYHIDESWLNPAQSRIGVVSDFLDDIAIQCNNYYLTEAFLNSAPRAPIYRYSFNSLPAVHGFDAGYTYYPNPALIPEVNATMAKYFQATIVNFLRYRNPTPEDSNIESWDIYEKESRRVMNFGTPDQHKTLRKDYIFKSGDDKMDLEKCAYWQSAPYYPDSEGDGFVEQNGDQERVELKV